LFSEKIVKLKKQTNLNFGFSPHFRVLYFKKLKKLKPKKPTFASPDLNELDCESALGILQSISFTAVTRVQIRGTNATFAV